MIDPHLALCFQIVLLAILGMFLSVLGFCFGLVSLHASRVFCTTTLRVLSLHSTPAMSQGSLYWKSACISLASPELCSRGFQVSVYNSLILLNFLIAVRARVISPRLCLLCDWFNSGSKLCFCSVPRHGSILAFPLVQKTQPSAIYKRLQALSPSWVILHRIKEENLSPPLLAADGGVPYLAP